MTKPIFDSIASNYDQWYETPAGQAVDYVERRAVKELFTPIGKNILEIGSGTGLYTVWLAEQGYNVTAVDVSSEMMEIAKRKVKMIGKEENVTWHHRDIVEVLPDLSFYDGILSMTAFEFVPEPEKVLQKLYALINPGGCLVIGVIADHNLWSEKHRQSAAKNPDSVFHKAIFYTEKELKSWDLGVEPDLRKVLYFSPQVKGFDEALQQEEKAEGNPGFLVVRWKK